MDAELKALREEIAALRREVAELRAGAVHYHYHGQPSLLPRYNPNPIPAPPHYIPRWTCVTAIGAPAMGQGNVWGENPFQAEAS